MTSAELNKELRKLQAEQDRILEKEAKNSTFVAAVTENCEEVRPEYDLLETDRKLAEIEAAIREIKHRLNRFNSTTVVDELGMTIDEVLIYLPQQSERIAVLKKMARHNARERVQGYYNRSNLIEYEYANYSVEEVRQVSQEAQKTLNRTQFELDRVNLTEEVS